MTDYPQHWEADVVLRDGSVAQVRPIKPSDGDALRAFHDAQSPESTYLRFFAPMKHLSDKDVHRFTHVDYVNRVALVLRSGDRLVGVGRFDRFDDGRKAEVAFNVADSFQGRGVGSVLLEHLAAIGLELGVEEFVADVLPQNIKMLSVFTEAGYAVKRAFEDGVVALSFPIEPTSASRQVVVAREQRAEATSLKALLTPQSVAVVGVSEKQDRLGRRVWQQVADGGYTGTLYAVNSSVHQSIPGVTIYQRVTDLPEPVDLVVIAVPAGATLAVIDDCATLGARSVTVLSEGFAEAGEQGCGCSGNSCGERATAGCGCWGPTPSA
ncbi:GNAT family N-acetyltransferase [Branchiibius cervicis]|uniref:GNAT family N-acetyltransferase n=1 Tax=Branchiibius cervicis TaxID=908252 RepID=A0ABW2AS98_9MICO